MRSQGAAQAQLDEGRIKTIGLIKIELGGGTYGFARSRFPITWSGLEYVPGGIIKVSDLPSGIGMAARQFTLTLAESPDDGLTPDVLQTIEYEDYRDRPVTIYDADFHPDTGLLLGVTPMRRGYINIIRHVQSEGEPYTIVGECESRALDYTRTNGRKRTDADQERRAPNDKFFQYASRRGREEVYWGREKKD